MGRSLALLAPVIGMLALAPRSARAGDADFRLAARGPNGEGLMFECAQPTGSACAEYRPRNDRFRAFAGQLGMVLAPRYATPAATLGHAGFELSAMWSGNLVASDEPYWLTTEAAQRSGTANRLLHTLHLQARKGLPLSFEVGASLQWVVDSELFAPGLELRWALEDMHRDAPDVAFRGAVSHMVGQREMSLTTALFEAVVSKEVGVLGLFELTPYAGWAVLLTTARSRVVDPTPAGFVEEDPVRPDVENDFVFEPVELGDLVNHRLTVGARMRAYVVDLAVQGEFRVLGNDEPVTGISVKFGLDY